MNQAQLKEFLDEKVALYLQPKFITEDPISIPHSFDK
ncbi:TIGR02757 family protein, partial [Flavobacteriales bacterium]|nr:TIGR02757 family protein [Flavobacteriales bacterium]